MTAQTAPRARSIELQVSDEELAERRARLEATTGYEPADRDRPVSAALRAYAAMVTSADRGAVRDVDRLGAPVSAPSPT